MAQEKFDGYFEYFTIEKKKNNNFEGEKIMRHKRKQKRKNREYRMSHNANYYSEKY